MPVRLNDVEVDWGRQDLSYLQPDAYRRLMRARLAGTISLHMDVLVTSLFRASIDVFRDVFCSQCGIRRRNTLYLRLDAYRRLMCTRLAGTSLVLL